jgi:hypothetical protein
LAKRGDTGAFYSATDAATLGTQMSVAAAGQVSRGGGTPPATARSGVSKRSGLIKPGSGSRPGGGTNTAVMERQSGGAAASGGSSGQATPGPRPRKGKRKRKR